MLDVSCIPSSNWTWKDMQLHYTNVSPEEAILKIAMIHTVIILEDPSVAPDQNISGRFTLICPVSQENKQTLSIS